MDMLRDVSETSDAVAINVDALKSEIRAAIIDQKVNAGPICMRVAWHSSGTFDGRDNSGGSNGGLMRFPPEADDGANAGLSIIRDLLLPVKERHPEISMADLWGIAGVAAVEFLGGPKTPFRFGRVDFPDDSKSCPGRLPDASQGAEHLREVFTTRMGFTDRDIVALSGAHTLGRCHAVRSGYDGPWTTHPLRFDNEYFRNLVEHEWVERKWDGPKQFEDKATGRLMMLPTDLALIQDPKFRVHVEAYAKDQDLFFKDFAAAYGRLLSLGCPARCDPSKPLPAESAQEKASADFRENAMHGSVDACKRAAAAGADVHALEATSGRSALHKAAFWGHSGCVDYLLSECKLNPNVQDVYGDTPLHDASKLGHSEVASSLLAGGADAAIKNKNGHTAHDLATKHGKTKTLSVLEGGASAAKKSKL